MNLMNLHINCCNTRAEWVARIISDIANPLMFPPLLFLAVMWEFNATVSQLIYVGIVTGAFFTVIPLLTMVYLKNKGKIESLDINDPETRNLPFLFTLLSYIAGAVLLLQIQTGGSEVLRILIICYLVNPIVGWLISQKWKISVHTASIGTSIALFFMLYQLSYNLNAVLFGKIALILLVLLLPAVMWARYQLRIHSLTQVFGGAFIGLLITYSEIMIILNYGLIP